jgi:regulatory protein
MPDELAEPSPSPADGDAIAQVRSWLVERGVSLPESEPVTGSPRQRSRRPRQPASGGSSEPSRRPESADGDLGPDADHESVARTIVLRKLAVQARTRAELSKALSSKQVPTEAADAVLDRMQEIGLVDDAEFARDWVHSRQQRRHLSRTALRRELSGKGVDREEIESALGQVDADDELRAARSLAEKKERATQGLDPMVRRRRLAGMLGRRGFSPGVISQVLAEGSRSADDESSH